jgi:hypothetical protein
VGNLITSYEKLGCNMSLKMHFLHSHLDTFPVNCGAISDEYGEYFHLDISAIENRYKCNWHVAMLVDCCWTVKRAAPEIQYKRQAKRRLDLLHVNSLLCPASIQQHNQFFFNQSQSRNLNASSMFCVANSTK